MTNKWIDALNTWNKLYNKSTYTIPKKGTKAYNEVKAIMNKSQNGGNFLNEITKGIRKLDGKIKNEKPWF